jgi:thiamine-phosphate pyrophosphorylase
MNLIVFSSSDKSLAEAKEVVQMFENGLEFFHLRKANFTRNELISYLDAIPKKFHKQIVLHSNHNLKKAYKLGGLHLSRTHRKKKYKSAWAFWKFRLLNSGLFVTRTYNKLSDLSEDKRIYKYVFLSPVYDSISKIGHSGNFGNRSIEKYVGLAKSPVIALGGVEVDKFEECKKLGFSGVALLGSIWNDPDRKPLEVFLHAQKTLKEL